VQLPRLVELSMPARRLDCMSSQLDINTGNAVYRIRADRIVDINTGNAVYRIRGDRIVDINTGNAAYRMRG
jgi:hypothetical protein